MDSINWFEGGKLKIKDIYGVVRGIGGLYFDTVDTPLQNLSEMFATIYDIREGKYG